MQYLWKQRIAVSLKGEQMPALLLVALDEVFARLLKHNLSSDFTVVISDTSSALDDIVSVSPHGLVIDLSGGYQYLSFIQKVSAKFPALSIITTGFDLTEDALTELSRAGVKGHINRKLSNIKDINSVIKNTLVI